MLLSPRDSVFVPGFNSGVSRATQYLTLHDLIHLQVSSESSSLKRAYYEHIVRPAVLKAGLVFTVSQTSKNVIQGWLRSDDVDVRVVGNGVSDAFLRARGAERPHDGYLMYVGNNKPHKNFAVIARLAAAHTDLRFVVVSADPSIQKVVDSFGVSDRVTVHAGVDDARLADLYAASAGLVMPSTLEGFGLPAAESLAVGRPVAYLESCESLSEIVAHGGVAISRSDDLDEWYEACVRFLGGDVPPDRSMQDFRWSSVASRINSALVGRLARTAEK